MTMITARLFHSSYINDYTECRTIFNTDGKYMIQILTMIIRLEQYTRLQSITLQSIRRSTSIIYSILPSCKYRERERGQGKKMMRAAELQVVFIHYTCTFAFHMQFYQYLHDIHPISMFIMATLRISNFFLLLLFWADASIRIAE